jgi:hypothetical protein
MEATAASAKRTSIAAEQAAEYGRRQAEAAEHSARQAEAAARSVREQAAAADRANLEAMLAEASAKADRDERREKHEARVRSTAAAAQRLFELKLEFGRLGNGQSGAPVETWLQFRRIESELKLMGPNQLPAGHQGELADFILQVEARVRLVAEGVPEALRGHVEDHIRAGTALAAARKSLEVAREAVSDEICALAASEIAERFESAMGTYAALLAEQEFLVGTGVVARPGAAILDMRLYLAVDDAVQVWCDERLVATGLVATGLPDAGAFDLAFAAKNLLRTGRWKDEFRKICGHHEFWVLKHASLLTKGLHVGEIAAKARKVVLAIESCSGPFASQLRPETLEASGHPTRLPESERAALREALQPLAAPLFRLLVLADDVDAARATVVSIGRVLDWHNREMQCAQDVAALEPVDAIGTLGQLVTKICVSEGLAAFRADRSAGKRTTTTPLSEAGATLAAQLTEKWVAAEKAYNARTDPTTPTAGVESEGSKSAEGGSPAKRGSDGVPVMAVWGLTALAIAGLWVWVSFGPKHDKARDVEQGSTLASTVGSAPGASGPPDATNASLKAGLEAIASEMLAAKNPTLACLQLYFRCEGESDSVATRCLAEEMFDLSGTPAQRHQVGMETDAWDRAGCAKRLPYLRKLETKGLRQKKPRTSSREEGRAR